MNTIIRRHKRLDRNLYLSLTNGRKVLLYDAHLINLAASNDLQVSTDDYRNVNADRLYNLFLEADASRRVEDAAEYVMYRDKYIVKRTSMW